MPSLSRLGVDVGVALGLLLALLGVYALDGPASQDHGDGKGKKVAGGRRSLLGSGSVYEDRTAENREELVKQRGGSPISEKAVLDGLDWLARHQAQDGSWSSRCVGLGPDSRCIQASACGEPGNPFAIAQTGLALLAFQAGGHYYFNQDKYSDHVRRGLDWLVKQLRDDDCLCHTHHYFMYEHAMGAFALAEACAVAVASQQEPDPSYLQAAQRAVRYIEYHQHNDGGWRYTNDLNAASDTSVSGWPMLALKTAKEAKLEVKQSCLDRVEKFFQSCEMKGQNGRTAYTAAHDLHTEATTGVGMLVPLMLKNNRDASVVRNGGPYLAGFAEKSWGGNTPGHPDYYLWYNCTLAMFLADGPQGPHWQRWNKVVRDRLTDLQEKGQGCARGSWAPLGTGGSAGGRIYSTALAVLTLEVYYRFAPQQQK